MKTKLTLRLDSDLIEKTKTVAASRNTSLSQMVTEFFRSLQDNYQAGAESGTPVLNEISGVMPDKKNIENPSVKYDKRIRVKYL
jgi:hypothetical protein